MIFLDTKTEYDATGKATYYAICKRLDTTPVSYFIKHMEETQINMQYHGIGVKGAKALAGALVVSKFTSLYGICLLNIIIFLRCRFIESKEIIH